MKMMNDMELEQITGGYLDVGGKPSDIESEMFENMVNGLCDAVCDGFSIVKYILFR